MGIGAVALVTTARSWRGSATVFTGVARGLAGRGHAVHAFVAHPALEDGFRTTAPVGSFPANGFGLFDMAGNVWEWCADWYQPNYYWRSPVKNPPGPESGATADDSSEPQRVRRGGSFLCAENYCRRYLPSARDKNPVDSSANHTGFRCVKDVE